MALVRRRRLTQATLGKVPRTFGFAPGASARSAPVIVISQAVRRSRLGARRPPRIRSASIIATEHEIQTLLVLTQAVFRSRRGARRPPSIRAISIPGGQRVQPILVALQAVGRSREYHKRNVGAVALGPALGDYPPLPIRRTDIHLQAVARARLARRIRTQIILLPKGGGIAPPPPPSPPVRPPLVLLQAVGRRNLQSRLKTRAIIYPKRGVRTHVPPLWPIQVLSQAVERPKLLPRLRTIAFLRRPNGGFTVKGTTTVVSPIWEERILRSLFRPHIISTKVYGSPTIVYLPSEGGQAQGGGKHGGGKHPKLETLALYEDLQKRLDCGESLEAILAEMLAQPDAEKEQMRAEIDILRQQVARHDDDLSALLLLS